MHDLAHVLNWLTTLMYSKLRCTPAQAVATLCKVTLIIAGEALQQICRLQPAFRWPLYVLTHAALLSNDVQFIQAADGPPAALTSPRDGRGARSEMPHRTAMDAIVMVINRASRAHKSYTVSV